MNSGAIEDEQTMNEGFEKQVIGCNPYVSKKSFIFFWGLWAYTIYTCPKYILAKPAFSLPCSGKAQPPSQGRHGKIIIGGNLLCVSKKL